MTRNCSKTSAGAVGLFALTLASAGCSLFKPPQEPAPQPPEPRLIAATDRQITLFGELPSDQSAPYQTRMGLGLRQHTFSEEGADFDPDISPSGTRMVLASFIASPPLSLPVP